MIFEVIIYVGFIKYKNEEGIMNKRTSQSILHTILLFFTLMLTTACSDHSGIVVVPSTTGNDIQPMTRSRSVWIPLELPDPSENADDPIETVAEDFLGEYLTGTVSRIEIQFQGQDIFVSVWDEDAIDEDAPHTTRLTFQQGVVTEERAALYTDDHGSLYLYQEQQLEDGHYEFKLVFQNEEINLNNNGNEGVLGYAQIALCEVERNC